MLGLFRNPDRFFSDEATSGSIVLPIGIVTTVGVIAMIRTVLWTDWSADAFDVGSYIVMGSLFGGVVGLLFGYAIWVGYAALFHIISGAFGGEGSFRSTIRLVGWGFVPKVFESLLTLILTLVVLDTTPRPRNPTEFERTSAILEQHHLVEAVEPVGILFVLWSGFLWMFAVHRGRSITIREAAICVCLPVIGSIAWQLNTLI